jgi:hypothetical protein
MVVVCAKCGKDVEYVCSNCWKCKHCPDEYCSDHMKRTINGHIAELKSRIHKK